MIMYHLVLMVLITWLHGFITNLILTLYWQRNSDAASKRSYYTIF